MRRPGLRTGLERGLDGGDELRGLRVDDDVPAEQHAADDLPGVRGRVVRAGADGTGLGHTPDCRKNGPGLVTGHAGFATPITTITGRRPPVRGSAGDRVANPSTLNTYGPRSVPQPHCPVVAGGGEQPPVRAERHINLLVAVGQAAPSC